MVLKEHTEKYTKWKRKVDDIAHDEGFVIKDYERYRTKQKDRHLSMVYFVLLVVLLVLLVFAQDQILSSGMERCLEYFSSNTPSFSVSGSVDFCKEVVGYGWS